MAFPKQLDCLVRGGDEFTLILASLLAEKKQSVLLVDEHGDRESHELVRLGYFEKRFLQELGKQFNHDALINIERYIKTSSLALYIQNQLVSFLSGPAQNGIELKRKYQLKTSITFDSSFEIRFFELTEKLLQLSLKGLHQKSVLTKFLKDEKESVLWAVELGKEFFELFPAHALYLKGFFSKKIHPDFYYIYLVLSLLGPSYHYNAHSFRSVLLEEFKAKGGHYKKTSLCDLVKHKQGWVAELESFEGLVYPRLVFAEKDLVLPEIVSAQYKYGLWEMLLELNLNLPWGHVVLPHHNEQGGFVPCRELLQIDSNRWLWRGHLEQPTLAHPDQLLTFLEEAFHKSMSILPFVQHYKKQGEFSRRLRSDYYYETDPRSENLHCQRGIFPSLLRIRDAIMNL